MASSTSPGNVYAITILHFTPVSGSIYDLSISRSRYTQDLSNPECRAWWVGMITNSTLGANGTPYFHSISPVVPRINQKYETVWSHRTPTAPPARLEALHLVLVLNLWTIDSSFFQPGCGMAQCTGCLRTIP